MTDSERLRRKREAMAKRRRDPSLAGRVREIQRHAYANGGAAKQRDRIRRTKEDNWFKWRVQFVRRSEPTVTVAGIMALWEKQDGCCALTGEALTRETAQIDHATPLTRGGRGLGITNLQWVTKQVNLAKRDLTNEEFLGLCNSVVEWLGRRLAQVER